MDLGFRVQGFSVASRHDGLGFGFLEIVRESYVGLKDLDNKLQNPRGDTVLLPGSFSPGPVWVPA